MEHRDPEVPTPAGDQEPGGHEDRPLSAAETIAAALGTTVADDRTPDRPVVAGKRADRRAD